VNESTQARPTHWANVGEKTFVFGTWLLYLVERYFGRLPFRVLLAPVLLFYVWRHHVAREASKEYLAKVGRTPSFWSVYRHIGNFAESLMDKLLAVSNRFPYARLKYSGREVMLDSIAKGKGGVLVTAHMGCLEVARLASVHNKTAKLNVLVHTKNAEQFNAILHRLNPNSQVRLIQVTDVSPATASMLSARVDAGEFVVLTADRVPPSDASGRTVPATFLGSTAHFPIGPWVLAAALKCQVIMFSVNRDGHGYHARFEKLADVVDLPRGKREEALARWVGLYAQKLEGLCRASPFDWFNFYPFWEPPRA
jgi:predicted LPLAT superfamily acyltransferase